MKKLFLTLALLCATITTLVAQEIAPSKNKFGALLSTNIFGFNDYFNKVDVGDSILSSICFILFPSIAWLICSLMSLEVGLTAL